MISVKINAFKTQEQAQEFCDWFTSEGHVLLNKAFSLDVPPIKIDSKNTFDSHGKTRWSGNTSLIVLEEKEQPLKVIP